MARLSLKCACGWMFFLPESTPGHQANCPNCASSVPIPDRKPGQDVPPTAGAIAARIQNSHSAGRWVLSGVAVLVVAGAAVLGLRRGEKFASESPQATSREAAITRLGPPSTSKPPLHPEKPDINIPPVPPDPTPLYSAAQIQEFRHNVFANVWLLNMSAILSEGMRYRGLTNDWAQFQANITIYEAKIKQNLTQLARGGDRIHLEPYLAQGDQIIRIAQKDLTTMRGTEAGQVIAVWANNWTPGAALEKVDVLRGTTALTFHLRFPEHSADLLMLLRHHAIQPELASEGIPTGPLIQIPSDVFNDVTEGLAALPPGYRTLLYADDRRRLEDLTASRKGTLEDLGWIKTRILTEALPSFRREADMIRSQVLALEPKVKENAATDVIIRKNGTKIEGQIIETTDAYVRIKSRFGSVPIQKEEIAKVEKGKGSATEFPGMFSAAKDTLEKLVPLLAWCSDKNLTLEKDLVAYTVLTLDASNEKARTAAGLGRPVIGATGLQPPRAEEPPRPAMGLEKAVAALALEVTSQFPAFTDVVLEMRRRTAKMTATQLPLAPDKSTTGLKHIQNPLTFDPSRLPADNLLEIGTWWGELTIAERSQFATFYALWCAVIRGRK